MSATGLRSFDHSVQVARQWVDELDSALGWGDHSRSYRLLGAVLQTLRDCLPIAQSAHFSAQLPLLLRGVYFEHWQPAAEHPHHWNLERFFAAIDTFFRNDPIEDTADAAMEVFQLLENRISDGEIRKLRACLPREIRDLWP
jgi:uncharacterized protein (DUF2267 family)